MLSVCTFGNSSHLTIHLVTAWKQESGETLSMSENTLSMELMMLLLVSKKKYEIIYHIHQHMSLPMTIVLCVLRTKNLLPDEISITIFLIISEYAIDKMDNILKEQKSKLRKVRTDGSGLDFSGYGHVGPVFFASGFGRVHCPGSSQESSRNPNPKKVKCDSYIFFFIFAYS